MQTMNAKYLGAFMLLVTQSGWAKHVLDNKDFTDFNGVKLNDTAFQNEFFTNLTKDDKLATIRQQIADAKLTDPQQTPGMKDIHRKLFEIFTSSMAVNVPGYGQPPCPSPAAVASIINAVNNA
jgi:hypothetical protein